MLLWGLICRVKDGFGWGGNTLRIATIIGVVKLEPLTAGVTVFYVAIAVFVLGLDHVVFPTPHCGNCWRWKALSVFRIDMEGFEKLSCRPECRVVSMCSRTWLILKSKRASPWECRAIYNAYQAFVVHTK